MSSLRSDYLRFIRKPYLWISTAVLLLLAAEMAFDLIEQALGRYWYGTIIGGRKWGAVGKKASIVCSLPRSA